MTSLIAAEIIECPYMPDGFIAMKDAGGVVVLNSNNGYTFRIPPITIEFESELAKEYEVRRESVVGYLMMKFRVGGI